MSKNKKLRWSDRASQEKIIDFLRSEEVIVGDSDTVPGLLVLASVKGSSLLDNIKGRSSKPYLLLVAGKQKLVQFVDAEIVEQCKPIMDAFWPGPLTIIMNAKKDIKPPVCTKEGTIAVRIPNHIGLQAILLRVPALFSTSANLAGEQTPISVDAIAPEIIKQVSAVVHAENQDKVSASTIIDCTQRPYKIIREGAIKKEKLKKYSVI